MKKILIITIILYSNWALGQNKQTQTFSGNFKNGTAAYSYYENDDYERIYNGEFKFNGSVEKYKNLNFSINGNFSDNLKEGKWVFSVKSTKPPVLVLLDFKENAILQLALVVGTYGNLSQKEIQGLEQVSLNGGFEVYKTYYSILSGNYVEGKLDGVWTFKEFYTSGKELYLIKKINYPINSTVFFKENRLIGVFSYQGDENNSVKGQFNNNGNLEGKWITKWIAEGNEFENISEYKNGRLINMIERNASTGEILLRDVQKDSKGFKIMDDAISFWVKDAVGFNKLDISKRNYMFKFNKGTIKQNSIDDTDRLRQAQEEADRIKKEQEDKKRQLDAMMGGLDNSDGSSGGEGDDNISGDKGKVNGDPNTSDYYGNGGSGGGGDYQLGSRRPTNKPKPVYECNEEGLVIVTIEVDRSGKVIKAIAGTKGSTNTADCLLSKAKEAALKTKWQADSNAAVKQIGIIKYRFSLSN